jgi:3-oxoacyl-[acyl-carrier-protein] synthase II
MSFPVAITGAGVITAAGRGLDAAWEALCRGETFLAPDPDPDLAGFAPLAAARCAPLDAGALGVDRRAARIMAHHSHMLMACVLDAAGPEAGAASGADVAFFAGMDSVDPKDADVMPGVAASRGADGGVDPERFFSAGIDRIHPLWPLGMMNAMGFCQAAIRFGLRGENAVFTPGAGAACQAVAEAAYALQEGKARAALAAGVSAVLSARSVARYRGAGLLRPASGSGAEVPRPFAGGDATALGEGACVLRMEPRGVLGEKAAAGSLGALTGWGAARSLNGAVGRAEALRRAAGAALRSAGREPGEVSLVVVHGDGRAETDAAEREALSALFGPRRPGGLATKGAFGHLLGAAPVLDLLLALRALGRGILPPSPGAAEGDFLRFASKPEEMPAPGAALVLAQGFDGVCGAFVAEAPGP